MSPSGLTLILCLAVFHPGNCGLAPFLKKHASALVRSQGLKFVEGMEIFGTSNDQRSVQAETDNKSPWFCHGLDCPAFKTLTGGSGYEAREYAATNWFSTNLMGVSLSKMERQMFMKLFDYIEGENVKKEKIKMTAPVLVEVIPGQGPACKTNFTMSFFDAPVEKDPPAPTDETVFFSKLPQQKVYVGSFPGFANDTKWLECADKLAAALTKDGKDFEKGFYITAGYDSPFRVLDRHNEVWYIAKD